MILLELARPADESPCEVTRVSTSNGTVAATSSMTQRTASSRRCCTRSRGDVNVDVTKRGRRIGAGTATLRVRDRVVAVVTALFLAA